MNGSSMMGPRSLLFLFVVASACSAPQATSPAGQTTAAPVTPAVVTGERLPTLAAFTKLAKRQDWGLDLKEITATAVDVGVMRNVPYRSFRSGDYEVNVYGDPDKPAAIEIGVYGKEILSSMAKDDIKAFMQQAMIYPEDKEVVRKLEMSKETRRREGVTFDVTPPNAKDAYNGFWITIYDNVRLQNSRTLPRRTGP